MEGMGSMTIPIWILDEDDERRGRQRRGTDEVAKKDKRQNVFISFDYDNDARLKDGLIGQSRYPNSPFTVADFSMKEAAPQSRWKQEAEKRIDLCSVVVVMCGQHTDKAAGVSAEIKIARKLGKPYFLLKGYPDKTCAKPRSAKSSDKMYRWTWDNLEQLLHGAR